jgi:hypothetical protein
MDTEAEELSEELERDWLRRPRSLDLEGEAEE